VPEVWRPSSPAPSVHKLLLEGTQGNKEDTWNTAKSREIHQGSSRGSKGTTEQIKLQCEKWEVEEVDRCDGKGKNGGERKKERMKE